MENSAVTGAVLVALILALHPVSAWFNPIISLLERALGTLTTRVSMALVASQLVGAAVGAVVANLMFDLPAVSVSGHVRSGTGLWLGDVVATLGLVVVVFGTLRATSLRAAHDFAARAHVGVVKINRPTTGLDLNVPFGGVKDSSSNTFREQAPMRWTSTRGARPSTSGRSDVRSCAQPADMTEALDLAALPKAELHLHFEASIRRDTAREWSERYRLPMPQEGPFEGLGQFVIAYEAARDLVGSLGDLERAAEELVEDASTQGVVWSEVHLIPPTYAGRLGSEEGIVEAVLYGLARGAEQASAAGQPSSAGIILGINRGLGLEAAERSLRLAVRYAEEGVVGLGLAGGG